MAEDKIDEESVRLTAYFMWEQEGRPNTNPSDYWLRALEVYRRSRAYGQELEDGYDGFKEEDPSVQRG